MTEEEWADYDRRRVDPHYPDSPPPYELLTEEEWLTSDSPGRMLEVFAGKNRDRKFRLFACACCRNIWDLLRDEQDRRAVEVAERFADGKATLEELVLVHEGCSSAHTAGSYASNDCRWEDMHFAAGCCAGQANRKARKKSTCRERLQAGLLRDIFGNPFRPPPPVPAYVLQWNDGVVRLLAEQAYNHRIMPAGTLDPDRLAVLADALEECGADAALVAHLRERGPHWRGCHALDAILGRT